MECSPNFELQHFTIYVQYGTVVSESLNNWCNRIEASGQVWTGTCGVRTIDSDVSTLRWQTLKEARNDNPGNLAISGHYCGIFRELPRIFQHFSQMPCIATCSFTDDIYGKEGLSTIVQDKNISPKDKNIFPKDKNIPPNTCYGRGEKIFLNWCHLSPLVLTTLKSSRH